MTRECGAKSKFFLDIEEIRTRISGPWEGCEPVIASALPVVPQLDDAVVQARQDPWALRVEGEALHPRALKRVREL